MREFFAGLAEIVIGGLTYGIIVFLTIAAALLMVASLVLTVVLFANVVTGKPAAWYEIIAPVVLFLGIGIIIYVGEN